MDGHEESETALDDRDRLLATQSRVLVQLARLRALEQQDLAGAMRGITEAASETIEAERVSIWLYDEERTRIRCVDLFERGKREHTSGAELLARDYPAYFRALETSRVIAAHDAQGDSRTREYTPGYLLPLGITSMLDVPIRLGGRMIGIVCHEHVGPARRWSADEQAFAGSIGDLVSLAMEVDERRRTEQALREAEEQFRQAQKMEAVGRLAGGLAHDLNNLLTAILGYADLLLARAKGAGLRDDLLEIKKAGDRAAALTRQLLAFSRKQVLRPKVIDLNSIVSGLEPMLTRLLGEDIELVTKLAPRLGRVKADPAQVEQVIMNLAVNARDAMPEGGRLTIETANAELDEAWARRHSGVTPGPHAMLAVRDSGSGMSKEVMSHLFEPFYTTKEQGKGTGLGLSTVYGIVRQSGGHVTAFSEPGRGSTFRVFLPRVDQELSAERPEAKEVGKKMGSETILVVEDEAPLRKLATRILAGSGYDVLEAADVEEAVTICEEHGGVIHLLLTDVVMPRMSGRQLADRILARRPELRVLYMSGYAEDEVIHHGVTELGAGFLQKPFAPDDLVRRVRSVLDGPAPA
ncbi:MAG: ATP-binding protein [Planctomycetota bacterium]